MNLSEKLEIGDIVKLNSGGPPMTVYNIKEGDITCRWMNNNDEIIHIFNKLCIKKDM
jgi:uncharacterized protein YodC (DUF2158 family)